MQQTDRFFQRLKPFPHFSKLAEEDKEEYNRYISEFPPINDISFATLMNWWNAFDALSVSKLNKNLVVTYYLPEFEKYSGLSLIGVHKVDESLCTLFDYLKEQGDAPKAVNVPEFVISGIRYPDMFAIKEQRALNEYIFSVKKFYPLSGMISHRRWAVNRFLNAVDEDNISVKSVDLSRDDMKQLLLDKTNEWHGKGLINTTFALEQKATRTAIMAADKIGLENMCIFVKGELMAFCLYQLPADEQFAMLNHARISTEIPHLFDFVVYSVGKWFTDMGVTSLNLDSDLGFMEMRMLKVALGPQNFFRKYTVEPAKGKKG